MPRSGPSRADLELIDQLGRAGLEVTATQLERWRTAGLLPRNIRHGEGRGRGSSSQLHPDAVAIATVLAEHARQGVDLRYTVLEWFIEAGHLAPGETVPEPPIETVRAALLWALRRSGSYRTVERARQAVTDVQRDAFYAREDAAARRAYPGEIGDVTAMRRALETGDESLYDTQIIPVAKRQALVHVSAMLGFGIEEIGLEAFGDALHAGGLFDAATVELWREGARDIESSGEPLPQFRFDPVADLEQASTERLLETRHVMTGLAGMGALYLMHGLLAPDTPGQRQLRTMIDQMHMRVTLMEFTRTHLHPASCAFNFAVVLGQHQFYQALYSTLVTQVMDGPPLLGTTEQNGKDFVKTWKASLARAARPAA